MRINPSSLVALLAWLAVAPCCAAQPDPAAAGPAHPYFNTDIVPILTKLGCNSGGCHGKATGQNGFKLSLLGYEPDLDFAALVQEARGRRIFPAAPPRSLLLLKATGTLAHGGGKRLEKGSEDYQTLLLWIEAGAPPPASSDPVLARITVTPEQSIFAAEVRRQPLRVLAHFSDGSARDVTRQAIYQANDPDLAEVNDTGVVQVKNRSGLFAVMVRYTDQIAVFHGTVPHPQAGSMTTSILDTWAKANARSDVDRYLVAQWKRLGSTSSAPVDDAAFLRRAALDICGTLPTPDEVKAYVADTHPDKRAWLIDRLLDRPEYASYFALKWGAILRNRGRGYSTSQQRPGTALFAGWIRDSMAANRPYDHFVSEILTAVGSQETNPPTVWYRTVRTTPDYGESVAQAFLGIRIQCAQCHHHPTERWSQADYYHLAACFARVGRKGGFADAEVPTAETIFLADEGEVVHPRTGKVMQLRPPGGPDFKLSRYDDPRRSLARWLTAPDNPYFARTMAKPTLARKAPQKPSFGSVMARSCRANQPLMPPYVAIPRAEAFGYQGAVYLRAAYNPFEVGADPNARDFQVPNLSLPRTLPLSSVRSRAQLLRELDTLQRDVDKTGTLEGLNSFKAQALEMVTGDRVRAAFDLNQEDVRLRDRYGRHLYGQSALLARRLVEAGSTCVTINTGYWDHHNEIEKGLEVHLPPLDAAIVTLIEDLEARGMLEDVVVYCAGEFGRTPLINGHAGRDHWSSSFSVLIGGGGLQGGQVIGASEPRGGTVREHSISPADLLATLYQALGIPLDTHYEDASGRPVSIVGTGQPIRELFLSCRGKRSRSPSLPHQ